MHVSIFLPILILITCRSVEGDTDVKSTPSAEPDDVKEFFNQFEKVMMNKVDDMIDVESKTEDADPLPNRKLRYLVPDAVINQQKADESIYSSPRKFQDIFNSYSSEKRNPVYNSNEMQERSSIVDFEGYQEFVFQPLYQCDIYDSSQRHCTFRRQLGTTLTLGVQLGEGLRRGMRIYWYRCLRKKYFDHIIKEPLNKGFLPWNLNLGGSGNELRISPISETDLSYNYFIAELVTPRAYRGKYGQKPVIRFDIEPIQIDMGWLYRGEEIVLYARSFMELPRTSVNFLWSLQEMDDFEDHSLPSNMELNADRSSVVIKELKTYQDQYLMVKAYSNKDFLLAKRTFLFKGFGNNKTSAASSRSRHKRSTEDEDEPDDESERVQYDEDTNMSSVEQPRDTKKSNPSEPNSYFQEVPEVSQDLFYDSGRKQPYGKRPFSDDMFRRSQPHSKMSKIIRRFIEQEEHRVEKPYTNEKYPAAEKPRFEDIESEMIATCLSDSDCSIRAVCTRPPTYGQKFCKCSHRFNGNGLFCYNS